MFLRHQPNLHVSLLFPIATLHWAPDLLTIFGTASKTDDTLGKCIASLIQTLAFLTACYQIGRVRLARENEAGDSWVQEIHILHVNR